MKTFLQAAVLLFFAISSAHADTWSKAELYYKDWDVLTRFQLSNEWVRKHAELKLDISDPTQLSKLLSLLDLQKLKKQGTIQTEDSRFVVDLYTDTGAKITYYASPFSLCTDDSAYKRPITKEFKTAITKLMKKSNQPVQPTPLRSTADRRR